MNKKISELNTLIGIISKIDSLRYGYFVDPEGLNRAVAKLSLPGIKSIWKKARKEIGEFSRSLAKSKKFRKYSMISILLKFFALISVTTILLSFTLVYYKPEYFPMLKPFVTPFFTIIFMVLIPNVYVITDYFVRRYVKNYLRGLGVKERKRLKSVINELVLILIKEAKKANIDRKKLEIKTFYADYNNLEVIKKPGLLRETYVTIPKF